MSTENSGQNEQASTSRHGGILSRRQILTAAAGVGAVVALPGLGTARAAEWTFPFFPQIASGQYTTESIREILDAVVTPHYLAATGATITLANADALGFTGWQLTMQQAAAARSQYFIDFLTGLGATPLATSFTFPPAVFSRRPAVLATAEGSATILVGMHMTATREFAELGQPTLAKWMYQMGTQVAEQRAIFRTIEAIGGSPAALPPNNKVFATDLFLYTRDVMKVLQTLGLVNGSTPPSAYPGRDAVLAAAGPMATVVVQTRPNDATTTVAVTGPASIGAPRA